MEFVKTQRVTKGSCVAGPAAYGTPLVLAVNLRLRAIGGLPFGVTPDAIFFCHPCGKWLE